MSIDQELVRELRQMFLDGATPSRLMNHIAERHGEDDQRRFAITDYFHEAFGIGLLRNVVHGEDYSPGRRHAHFNRDVVPEMVEGIAKRNPESAAGTWLEGLNVAPERDHVKRLETYIPEGLSRIWNTLNDDERLVITRTLARKDRDWQVMKCLAQLAERLQEKVTELEARAGEGHVVGQRSEAE